MAEASSSASVSSATMTARENDIESQQEPTKVSFWRILTDQAGVTPEALSHNYAGLGTQESPYLVEFLPKDHWNPMTHSKVLKWMITITQATAVLAVTFASSAYSGGVQEVMLSFKVSTEVAILGVSLFVLGFAVGPLLWAPISEMYGRQYILGINLFLITAFLAGSAGSQNIETLIVLRFFAGAFGSAPLTNSAGVIADMFSHGERGIATSIFAMAPFLGPTLGPIAGGFLGHAAGFRWLEGMMAIFMGVLWLACVFLCPETYAPRLLRVRAKELSRRTGKKYICKLDAGKPKLSIKDRLSIALLRPWILLFKEPIVLLTSIYMAIIYGTLYLAFAAFPIVFQKERGWSPGVGGLAFLGMLVGMFVAVTGNILDNKRFMKVVHKHKGIPPPEARLPSAIVGSILLPVGLFWFAWTSKPSIHFIVPIIGSSFFGAGLVLVFLSIFNYLIDTYVIFAASAIAANTVLRSLFGAAFPLFTTYMYEDLGLGWAGSIPAFLALACVPVPFLFWKYGHAIREKCKYASEAEAFLHKMRESQAAAAKQAEAAPAETAVVGPGETASGETQAEEKEPRSS